MSLDKSLDDIISSSRKSIKSRRATRVGKVAKSGKSVGSASKKPIVSFKKSTPVPKTASVDLSYATKVVVSGLPKDIRADAIKDFFQSQVGGVGNIALSYNERGQFKGIATIIFKNNKSASLAVEKYNGAPIDGGSSKLKLELIIDPTKKPLTSRIAPNAVAQPVAKSKAQALKARVQAAKARQGVKTKADTKKKTEKPKKAQKPKKVKKTVEELDREMSEYFNN